MGLPEDRGRAAQAGPPLFQPHRPQGAPPPWLGASTAAKLAHLAGVRASARRPDPRHGLLHSRHGLADPALRPLLCRGGQPTSSSTVGRRPDEVTEQGLTTQANTGYRCAPGHRQSLPVSWIRSPAACAASTGAGSTTKVPARQTRRSRCRFNTLHPAENGNTTHNRVVACSNPGAATTQPPAPSAFAPELSRRELTACQVRAQVNLGTDDVVSLRKPAEGFDREVGQQRAG